LLALAIAPQNHRLAG